MTQKYLFEYLPYFSTDIARTRVIPSRNVSTKRRRSGARILRRGMVEGEGAGTAKLAATLWVVYSVRSFIDCEVRGD